MPSFDVVSKTNLPEVDNAINGVMRETNQRFDLKGTKCGITRSDSTLKTTVGLAAWSPSGSRITVPTLLLCGSSDITAPCRGSQTAYNGIPNATPKMFMSINRVGHLSWFGPTNAGGGTSGEYARARS
jgi:pimeloyl-ACP methyl ester carboxylesterase